MKKAFSYIKKVRNIRGLVLFQLCESLAEWTSYSLLIIVMIEYGRIGSLTVPASHGSFAVLASVSIIKLLFSRHAGILVDTHSWFRTMFFSALLRIFTLAMLVLVLYFGDSVNSALVGCILVLFFATQAATGLVIDSSRAAAMQKEIPVHLRPELSSLSMFLLTGVAIASSLVAGLLAEWVPIYAAVAILFVTSVIGVVYLFYNYVEPDHRRRKSAEASKTWFADTVSLVLSEKSLRLVFSASVVYGLVLGVIEYILPLYSLKTLNLGVEGFVLLTSVFTVANLLGTLFAARVIRFVGDSRSVLLFGIGMSFCYLALCLSSSVPFVFFAMFVNGLIFTFFSVAQGPILQRLVPEGQMGSVMSFLQPVRSCATLVGVVSGYSVIWVVPGDGSYRVGYFIASLLMAVVCLASLRGISLRRQKQVS